jgi:hypothetical protein
MPKVTIFSFGIGGVQRRIFTVQERSSSGDLTVVVRHSQFNTPEGQPEKIPIVQERCSIHRSPASADINAIKHTKILKGGKSYIHRHYSKALKSRNQFAGVFVRRAGDLSDARYAVDATATCVSLGEYDPEHFQPVYLVLVGPREREFVRPPQPTFQKINFVQSAFQHFSIVVLWQFLMLSGNDKTSRALNFYTFDDDQIANEQDIIERDKKIRASFGFSEHEALAAFAVLKFQLRDQLVDVLSANFTEQEKANYGWMAQRMKQQDLFAGDGRAFTLEHRYLLNLFTFGGAHFWKDPQIAPEY